MFIQKHFPFSVINIETFCIGKALEARALKLDFLPIKVCIITVYRSRNGNFQYFIKGTDNLKIYKPNVQLIICGDINFSWNLKKQEVNNTINLYNLVSVMNFHTRVKNNSRSAIDNVFLDTTQLEKYTICSMVNGSSDHDAQILQLHVVNLNSKRNNYKITTTRKIDFNSTNEFKDKTEY